MKTILIIDKGILIGIWIQSNEFPTSNWKVLMAVTYNEGASELSLS